MRCHESMILQGLVMPSGRWKQRPLWRWIVSGNPKVKVCNHSLPSRSVYDMKLAISNILKKQHFGADHQLIPQTEPLQGAKKSQPNLQGEKSKTIYWSVRWWFQKRTNHPQEIDLTSSITRWWFQIFCIFTPIWGRSNLMNIFQMGWFNHQPEDGISVGQGSSSREARRERDSAEGTGGVWGQGWFWMVHIYPKWGGGRGWRHNFQILDELHNFFWNGHIVDTDVSNGNMKICELSFHGELGLWRPFAGLSVICAHV